MQLRRNLVALWSFRDSLGFLGIPQHPIEGSLTLSEQFQSSFSAVSVQFQCSFGETWMVEIVEDFPVPNWVSINNSNPFQSSFSALSGHFQCGFHLTAKINNCNEGNVIHGNVATSRGPNKSSCYYYFFFIIIIIPNLMAFMNLHRALHKQMTAITRPRTGARFEITSTPKRRSIFSLRFLDIIRSILAVSSRTNQQRPAAG